MRAIYNNIWVRKGVLVLMDLALVSLAAFLSLQLRFEGEVAAHNALALLTGMPIILLCYEMAWIVGGVYNTIWRYAGVKDLERLAVSAMAAAVLTLLLNQVMALGIYRGVLILIALLSFLLVGGARFVWRALTRDTKSRQQERVPLLVVGAGEAGAYVITSFLSNPQERGKPVVLVDDDPRKRGMRVQNIPVKGRMEDIPTLVKRYGIQEIVIAIPSASNKRMERIIALCTQTKCHIRIVSDPSELGREGASPTIRELNAADFLPRPEIQLDSERVRAYITGKVVLVTGGGGSIGSEICRQVLSYGPQKLVIFDIYENNVYELEAELTTQYGPNCPVDVVIGSIRDRGRLLQVFGTYHPQVVFHAAAHKHVPMMEGSPGEAVKNNVQGTLNLLEVASESGVERLVQLSTDKAVNPTNVMGATKRITEMLIQCFAQKSDMKCMAVRFGNVLGSHGSVIPLMEAQIKNGGPVKVTHPDITRYFMTIPEAVQLVLQAGGLATSGAIYVLDMGQPVRIYDLAEQLIRYYGYEPGVNMQIEITGLRPGEKLYEELLTPQERDQMQRTAHNKIFVAPPIDVSEKALYRQIAELNVAAQQDDGAVVRKLAEVVDTYHPNLPEESA